jgi:hypothetical protein
MTPQNTMAARNKFFPQISKFILSAPLLEASVKILQAEGRFKVESILFWAGTVQEGIATVSHILVPKGPGVFQRPLHIRVDESIIAALCDVLDPPRLVLLGQVHTHLADAFHSYSDDHFSFDTPGLLSAVVPNAGRDGADRWSEWAFFECLGGPEFKPLENEELDRRLTIGSHDVEIHEIHAR